MDKNTLFSSFGKWLSPICTKTFAERVNKIEQDKYVKKLTTLAYLKLFLHAQLHQRDGLREIADDLLSKGFQKELGILAQNVVVGQCAYVASANTPQAKSDIFGKT
ncbi:DUF4372 domain-containing protein [Paenibacillus ginsengihumi]|jgi:hypothetical protein|uniref:DUF4372 domain-containing protein n=1 Tax=Paenibacillus ginsengihumi TaxID=431596 RepID=UPI00037C3B25|nr:DUF4372 domain-containing protein [Paenibacillus ginsengihumi]